MKLCHYRQNDGLIKSLEILTKQVEQLSAKLQSLERSQTNVPEPEVMENNLKTRVENLEKIKVLRSCHELQQYGVTKNGKLNRTLQRYVYYNLLHFKHLIIGKYMIDPDGQGIGEPPIEVRCVFGEGDGAITEIDHQNGTIIVADQCSGKQCFSRKITYSASKNQMLALKSISTTCTQALSYGCFLAPLSLNEENLGGWLDVNGEYYI